MMKKNISTQEAHLRTIAGVVLLLIALFLIDNAGGKIFFAILAAGLAGTAFLHSCPLYTLMGKSTIELEPSAPSPEANTVPMPAKPIVGMEEESTPISTEEVAEEKTV